VAGLLQKRCFFESEVACQSRPQADICTASQRRWAVCALSVAMRAPSRRNQVVSNGPANAILRSIESRDILAAMSSQELGEQKAETLRDQYQTLLEVTESIVSHRDLSELFHDLAKPLRNVLHFDYLSVRLHDPGRNVMRIHILEKSAPGELVPELPVDESLAGFVWQTQQALLIDDIEREVRFPRAMQRLRANHIRSCCCLPLSTAHRRLGAMTIGSVREKAYQPAGFRFLEEVARQVAVAIGSTNYGLSTNGSLRQPQWRQCLKHYSRIPKKGFLGGQTFLTGEALAWFNIGVI
jgi:GAF domain-containing protein